MNTVDPVTPRNVATVPHLSEVLALGIDPTTVQGFDRERLTRSLGATLDYGRLAMADMAERLHSAVRRAYNGTLRANHDDILFMAWLAEILDICLFVDELLPEVEL